MKKMSIEATKNTNGGNYHCEYCGYSTWAFWTMDNHQMFGHWGKKSRYHFHWSGPTGIYYWD